MSDEPAETVTISAEEYAALKARPVLDPIQENMRQSLEQNWRISKGEVDVQALTEKKALTDPAAISSRENLENTRYRPAAGRDAVTKDSLAMSSSLDLLMRVVLELSDRVDALEAWKKATEQTHEEAVAFAES